MVQQRGHVGTVWNVLYLPELQLRDRLLARLLARLFVKRYRAAIRRACEREIRFWSP